MTILDEVKKLKLWKKERSKTNSEIEELIGRREESQQHQAKPHVNVRHVIALRIDLPINTWDTCERTASYAEQKNTHNSENDDDTISHSFKKTSSRKVYLSTQEDVKLWLK